MAPILPTDPPRSEAVASAAAMSTVWLDAVEAGSRAWVSACTGFAETCMAAGQAQAEAAGQLMAFWMRGLPTGPGLPPADQLLREQLMYAENQAERTADAARKTLQGLKGLEPKSAQAEVPVPLPE